MLFSSALFLTYFLPLFLVAYYAVPIRFKNYVALAGSLVFYTWGAPVFALVLVASGSIDFYLSRQIALHDRRALILGLALNVLTLFIFKYFNFFTDNARAIVEGVGFNYPHYADIALPLGISFFTFQKISYLVDVYRKDAEPAQSLSQYLLFVFLFPQLIAGPIIRFKDIDHQLSNRFDTDNWNRRLTGLQLFCLGLAKKILVADQLATIADKAFAGGDIGSMTALIGLIAYTFQIYFDFAGYSDMAIGLGRMMGFEFPENFRWPYVAKGFKEFWSRWHITLSTWMRDYLYVPLGGNKFSAALTMRNLWIVFLLSGLWHGASWNFVIWGAWHGLLLTIGRHTKIFEKLPGGPSTGLTFILVMLGWVWFRADDLTHALDYFEHLFRWDAHLDFFPKDRKWWMLIIAVSFSFVPRPMHDYLERFMRSDRKSLVIVKSIGALMLLVLCLGQIALADSQPFIYFRF
ncbi:MAG: MBOAT family protein [Flavobacteriales bacterium]|nr:MBOAT family protein [Flavobacteriales bacterium]NCG30621.1 MBOAT family protein [Bacteroidota bacterium]MBT3964026.1 MBOAT family protein [Flavobacteriales bacterium]MBT4704510.1 MBOAT family protein [Flavobacteriales bacterium]MBT4931265.1 MBOAT family protein [Flavobacteriales bacterium]